MERVVEYSHVPQEAPAVIDSHRPPAYWPSSNGELCVDKLVIKYAQDLPPALRGISFTVKPTEKIGVVSLTHCLYTFIFSQTFTRWEELDPVHFIHNPIYQAIF